MEWPEKLSSDLHKALLAARKDAKEVAKSDKAEVKNKEGRLIYTYDFTSGEDMVAFCRDKLHEHGLTFELVQTRVVDPDTNTVGWPILTCRFHVVHAESGSWEPRSYDMPFPNSNDLDKKAGGAMTYVLGQAHRCLLDLPKVSKGDAKHDPDRRTEEVSVGTQRRTSQRKTEAKTDSTFLALTQEIGRLANDYRENVGPLTDAEIAFKALGNRKPKRSASDYATIRNWLKEQLVLEEEGPGWMDNPQEPPA